LSVGVQSEALFVRNSVLSVGVQSEALFVRAKLRFELQQTRQNRLDSVLGFKNLAGLISDVEKTL
jgi:hypothetical protein